MRCYICEESKPSTKKLKAKGLTLHVCSGCVSALPKFLEVRSELINMQGKYFSLKKGVEFAIK